MLQVFIIYAMGWIAGSLTVWAHLKHKAEIEANNKRVRPEDLRPRR